MNPSNLSLQGRTVLVVDDDPDTLEIVALSLQFAGARVASATSSSEALRALDQDPLPDVVLTDLSMPEADGYDFVQQLRTRPQARGGRLPAVAFTAGARDPQRESDFVAFLRKPIEPKVLVAAVEAAVSR